MKKDTKIIKAIVQCILEYSMLKSGNISTEIPSGVAYQLPTRDFIRAWMQSHYNIIKLSGYFYRRFKKIFDNVDYWKEQIDQNRNNINETFNNDIQAKENNIDDAIDDLTYIQFEDPIVEKICHEQLHVYTYADAKKIIELNARSGFYNSEIKSFDELKYFINLKKIEKYTFYFCKSLQQINIPNSVTEIGVKAFAGCKTLQEITLPNNVTEIQFMAFAWCSSLQQINIPNNLNIIGDNTFNDCRSLKEIKLPDNIISIGYQAFCDCTALQQINIPDNIETMDSTVFNYCRNLKTIYVSKENYENFKYDYFSKFLKIKDSSNSINETFNNDIQSQEDNIENTLAELGDLSKQEFITKIISKLKDNGFIVNIDNNNHNYSNFSFGEIKDANFNDHNHYDVPEILISWFSTKRSHGKAGYAILCIKLYDDYFGFSGTIYRQKSTTNFKDFIHTDFESSIIFPKNQDDSVNDVSCIIPFKGLNTKDAFWRYTYNYHNLYSLIETINYLWSIRDEASKLIQPVSKCKNILIFYKELIQNTYDNNKLCETFNNNIQSQKDDINGAINDLSYIKFKDPEVERICHEQLHVYTYEDAKKVTNLCNFSRNRNIKYFNELKYFTNLKKINDYAFVTCSQLKQITLPDSITEIGECAFSGCTDLLKINIPKNVIKIDDEAFSFCQSLKQIIISNDECKIGEETFGYCKSLEEIILPKNITEIPDGAFLYCSSLKHINIPNKVTKIGDAAFYQCESLQHINIPNKVIKIGNNAFEYCKSLQSIIIPDNIMEIGQDVFTYCDNLKNIYVSKENYTKLRKYKFRNFLKIVDNNNSNLINETFNNEIQSKDEPNIDQAIENISVSKNIISQDKFYQLLLKFLKNNKFIDESKESVLGVKQWYGHHEKGYYYNKYLSPKVENENEIYSMHTLNIVLVDIPQINEDTEQHQHDIVYIKILSNPNLDYDIDKDSNTFNITLNYAPNILPKDDLNHNHTKFNYKIQYPILDMNYEKMINLNGYFTYRMSTAAVYDIKNIITKMFYNNNYLKDLLINDYEVLGYPCLDDVRFKKYIDGFLDRCHF